MNSKYKQMWENLQDPDFRKQFIDAHVDEGIAFQIRSLRNKKELTQPKFAQALGVKQPLVSAWENPTYGKYSLNTLKKLAKAFDVGLLVRFVPFSSLVDWTINLTPNLIAPPSFEEEDKSLFQFPDLDKSSLLLEASNVDPYDLKYLTGKGQLSVTASTTRIGELANVT